MKFYKDKDFYLNDKFSKGYLLNIKTIKQQLRVTYFQMHLNH